MLRNMALENRVINYQEQAQEKSPPDIEVLQQANTGWRAWAANLEDENGKLRRRVGEAIVPDRMHTLDLGLFKYMLDYTKELLNDQCERQVMQIFEQQLTLIPRHKGLKILKNISEIITRMTADELRNLLKVIIFMLDNLYKDYRKPGISNEWLCRIHYKFL
ncbi:hypothetical protein C2G38_2230062 [Gigaspora rosea]|uniref:Uncharacterized protein n=1 Tax=Gigaspora rosea TaxID=44941 RepID=A0A397TUI0_9GLOM|nr:hypothetical protein C2G38_2230062 [Gigaspora rosea]